jgi:hypothetical protein
MRGVRLTFIDKVTLKLHYQRHFCAGRMQKVIKLIASDLENRENIDSESQKINYSKKLIYIPENSQTSVKSFVFFLKLLVVITRVRGLTRWLCERSFRMVDFDFYQISRLRLFCFLIANFVQFRAMIVQHLRYNYVSAADLILIPFSTFTHRDTNFKVVQNQTYQLQLDLKNKVKYRRLKNQPYLLQLMLWDSRITQDLLNEIPNVTQNKSYSRLIKSFPDFKMQLITRKRLNVDFHQHCDLTFDQRYENNDLRKPDFIENVKVLAQRFIIKDNRWIVIDVTCNPRQSFVAGQWQFLEKCRKDSFQVYLNTPDSRRRVVVMEKAIFLIGRADENWYHFLLDTLPRYLFLRKLDNTIPLLIRDDLPRTTLEFVAKITSHPIALINVKDSVEVGKLYFYASRSTTFDSKPTTMHKGTVFSPVIIAQLRKFILSKIHAPLQSNFPLKLYIPRTSKYRRALNNFEIFRFLKSRGYVKIITNNEFFARQFSFFENAKLIVSEGGAVCANMLFMRSTSSILVLRSWRNSRENLWKLLAEACQVNYHEVKSIPTYFGLRKLRRQHSDYFVLMFAFKKKVKKLE